MEYYSFSQMLELIHKLITEYPDNENYQKMLALLIQKKSEYDLEKMKADKEAYINDQNNWFKWCMQNAAFSHQWNLTLQGNVQPPLLTQQDENL
jgi:hypothetical protein